VLVDDASTRQLVTAFAQALGDVGGVENSVDATGSYLRAAHTGDAANRFQASLGEWLTGLREVRQALLSIDEEMQGFARQTASTEDDNTLAAATAFLGAGL